MTPDQAAVAWRREIHRVAPDAPAALQQCVAEQLAGDADPVALALLGRDLVRVAEVVIEEAASRVAEHRAAVVIPLRRAAPRPDDFPPAAA
jgi:hypothetical protein